MAEVANPLTPVGEVVEQRRPSALVSVEQQRAIAEVQARMMIARANPRDAICCMDAILQDCMRPTLAETAVYQYARGGTAISGPSIRLAEAIARRWGNIAAGIKEISRQNGYSECVAYAWDLETGYYDERQFQVRHWRDTKRGGYQIADERDLYELVANMGQRRKRAVLLSVIPGDVVDAAVAQCEETLQTHADISPEGIKKMIAAFGSLGVTKEQIEARCQCRAEAIRPMQLVSLRKIYASIKDGMSESADWFAPLHPVERQPPRGTAELRERLRPTVVAAEPFDSETGEPDHLAPVPTSTDPAFDTDNAGSSPAASSPPSRDDPLFVPLPPHPSQSQLERFGRQVLAMIAEAPDDATRNAVIRQRYEPQIKLLAGHGMTKPLHAEIMAALGAA